MASFSKRLKRFISSSFVKISAFASNHNKNENSQNRLLNIIHPQAKSLQISTSSRKSNQENQKEKTELKTSLAVP